MHDFLETAKEAAHIGGEILMRSAGDRQARQVVRKQTFDFVTEVDRSSEEAIVAYIRKRHPEHKILAEESGGDREYRGYVWVIDPLDGTKNYIHNFPMFGVSVALTLAGIPVAGAILDPVRDELFYAGVGQGAFLNGLPIRVSETEDYSTYLLATGFPFRAKDLTEQYLQAFSAVFRDVSDLRRAGAASLDLAYVACGRLDGFWEITLNVWDIAAGVLLIQEAGGKVTDIWGGERHLQTGHIIGSNGHHHYKLSQTLRPVFANLA